MQPDFIEAARQALVDGGELRFTTDHEDYFKWMLKQWEGIKGWSEGMTWDASNDPLTDFQMAFQKEGRTFYRSCWKKMDSIYA
jgi:tRNA G46 methylase TrmB